MKMRAKLKVLSVKKVLGNQELLEMVPVAASVYPSDGSDENNTYAKWSPSGKLELTIANPTLLGKFLPGDCYYVDFTPAPD